MGIPPWSTETVHQVASASPAVLAVARRYVTSWVHLDSSHGAPVLHWCWAAAGSSAVPVAACVTVPPGDHGSASFVIAMIMVSRRSSCWGYVWKMHICWEVAIVDHLEPHQNPKPYTSQFCFVPRTRTESKPPTLNVWRVSIRLNSLW